MRNIYLTLVMALFILLRAEAQVQVGIVSVIPVSCAGNCDGSAVAVAIGGVAPYSFLWNDPNAQITSTASGLCAGLYSVVVTDSLGESGTASVTISEPTPITISGTVTPECVGVDGQIALIVSGGVPPYAFIWGNGSTEQDLLGLNAGPYQVTVIDGIGCDMSEMFQINEYGLTSNVSIISNDPCTGPLDLHAVSSGGSGNYTYIWSTGETTETISISDTNVVQVTVSDDLGCSATATACLPTVGGGMSTHVSGWLNWGFCRWLYPLVTNNDCLAYTGSVSITLDAAVEFNNITPTPDDISASTITWNNVTIPPIEQFAPQIQVCVPLNVACGDSVEIQITAEGNTEETHVPLVFCSYDPNDKQVSPIGIGSEGFIPNDEELTYTIRFQNTGTAAATFIHVLDELDAGLDILSLRVLAASHPMELSISENNVLDFFFDNINLPDSTTNLAESQGFIIYAIDMLPGLSEGTMIENTAEIYFDFNTPVITNTTVNTIETVVEVGTIAQQSGGFSAYPNPSSGFIQFNLPENGANPSLIQLIDMLGNEVLSVPYQPVLDISGFSSGSYIVTISVDEKIYHQLLIVE